MKDLGALLAQREADHLLRRNRISSTPQGADMVVDGRPVISFCSNDYLGLANEPRVIAALKRGADQYGVGSGAAHLVNGHSAAHQQLEEALAAFTGREAALLFSTGYMANMGIISALLDKNDEVFEDKLNHASLIDGARLAGCKFSRYLHNDINSLATKLAGSTAGEKLINCDGVFSMDGDIAPLGEMARLARAHDSWLMVDDAHGIGVLGNKGAGLLEQEGLTQQDVPILMGTLGKALGTAGAFVAGSRELIHYLTNFARTYIYTTASPPALAVATLESLAICQNEPERRAHLHMLIQRFRQGAQQLGLQLMPSSTPIQPIVIGDSDRALKISAQLLEMGLLVTAIRPPTVPRGTARLRVTLSYRHTTEHVDRLLDGLEKLLTRTDFAQDKA